MVSVFQQESITKAEEQIAEKYGRRGLYVFRTYAEERIYSGLSSRAAYIFFKSTYELHNSEYILINFVSVHSDYTQDKNEKLSCEQVMQIQLKKLQELIVQK